MLLLTCATDWRGVEEVDDGLVGDVGESGGDMVSCRCSSFSQYSCAAADVTTKSITLLASVTRTRRLPRSVLTASTRRCTLSVSVVESPRESSGMHPSSSGRGMSCRVMLAGCMSREEIRLDSVLLTCPRARRPCRTRQVRGSASRPRRRCMSR